MVPYTYFGVTIFHLCLCIFIVSKKAKNNKLECDTVCKGCIHSCVKPLTEVIITNERYLFFLCESDKNLLVISYNYIPLRLYNFIYNSNMKLYCKAINISENRKTVLNKILFILQTNPPFLSIINTGIEICIARIKS